MDPAERKTFAKRVGTSIGYCQQIAYGHKRIELGLADAFVAAAGGKLGLGELPLTDRAKHQRAVRGWDGRERRSAGADTDPVVSKTYTGPDRRKAQRRVTPDRRKSH